MHWMDIVVLGGVLTLSRFVSPLLNRAFCVRNAPRWIRNASDVASGFLGLRLTMTAFDIPPGYWSAAIFLAFGIVSIAVFGYHVYAVFWLGDRCPTEPTP